MPQAVKIPAAKAAVDKEWEKLEKISAWNLTKSQKQETSDRWPGVWGPQGMSITGGGGLARVPNLRVCEHLFTCGVAHAGEKDE